MNRSQKLLGTLLMACIGTAALMWFLIRVIPKPSRAAYPCQQAAFPIASAFVLWIVGAVVGWWSWQRLQSRIQQPMVAGILATVMLVGFIGWSFLLVPTAADAAAERLPNGTIKGYAWSPGSPNTPIGVARGINPGRVVWAHDPQAAHWSGDLNNKDARWWTDACTDQTRVDAMLSASLRRLTNTSVDSDAWLAIFHHYNLHARQLANRGHQVGEIVAIKINLNNSSSNKQDAFIDATPQTVLAVVRQLVLQAHVPAKDILVYDGRRTIPPFILKPVWTEFPEVRFVQDPKPKPGTNLEASEWIEGMSYSAGSFNLAKLIPKQIMDATYLINLAILKAHSYPFSGNEGGDEGNTGVTLCGKNHFGSIKGTSELHANINPSRLGKANSYSPIVDLAASPNLGAKTILFLHDGLYCGRRYKSYPMHFPNAPFNNRVEPYANSDWPSTLLASLDGVAIDAVAIDIFQAQCRNNVDASGISRMLLRDNTDGYLSEMALADHPPSGTRYIQGGKPVVSLGTYEHWDSDTTRRYSRNLDRAHGIGIDLQYLPFATPGCEKPAIVRANGTVTLTCATPGARIHYTLDGSTPTESSPRYANALVVSDRAPIIAVALADDRRDSELAISRP